MTVRLEDSPQMTAEPSEAMDGMPVEKGLLDSNDLRCAKDVRILIVDDDEATSKVIEAALQGRGYHIDRVNDPAQVQRALESGGTYHVLMLDYVLPGLEAEQVFAWVRDYQPEASIIVVTGYPTIDSALSCLRARTFDYITKPFEISHLRHVVTRCLTSKGLLRMSEETLRESLGMAIRERRKNLGLTLAQMAARTDVSLGYLSQIELGKNSASIETLYRICLALGIRLSELFNAVQRGN
jgi:DNA-binding response OmpR family regulator